MRKPRRYQFRLPFGTAKRKRKCRFCGDPKAATRKVHTCGSVECREKYFAEKLGPRPISDCAHCGSSFTHARSAKRTYCSYQCHIDGGGASKAGMMSKMAIKNYGAKKDANHKSLVDVLESLFVGVIDTSGLGGGFPDLICAVRHETLLVEIKNPESGYGKKGLNDNQKKFAEEWRGGPVYIIKNECDCVLLANGNLDSLYAYGGFEQVNVVRSEQ